MRCSLLLLIALATALPAAAGTVTLTQAQWQALQPPDAPKPDALPGPSASRRVVTVEELDGALRITAVWELSAAEPGWYDERLVTGASHVRRLTWDGEALGVNLDDGALRVTGWVDHPVRIELVAELPADLARGAVPLHLAPAVVGRATAPTGLTLSAPDAVGDGATLWGGAAELRVQRTPPPATRDRGTLAVAHAGLGLTVGDAEVRAQAHLQWELRQGELAQVRFQATGAGADLAVTGPAVRSWTRQGDVITVALQHPQRQRVDLALSWSTPSPDGSEAHLALPELVPLDAFRTESAVQLARDGDVDVLPRFDGWSAIAGSALPEWAQGLVLGTPTAAYQRTGGVQRASVDLLRLELLEQPPVVVDLANATIALTEHGRSLTRVVYQVRNERAANLHLVPPPGSTVLGVRVAGETATPGADGADGLLIPLPRSLETVAGMLTFPVEISLLTDASAWDRREQRDVPLPRVSAPIAAAHTTVYLPEGYRNLTGSGEDGVVDSFSEGEGIAYGFGVGDAEAAAADALLQEAVNAWMRNDFDAAQEQLDTLEGLGLGNENASRLQSNLDLVDGKSLADADSVVARRVKDQAKARAKTDEVQAEVVADKAKKAAEAGNYEEAADYYQQAIDISGNLARLEQNEAVEYKERNVQLQAELGLLAEAETTSVSLGKMRSRSGSRSSGDTATAAPSGADGGDYADDLAPPLPQPSTGYEDVELYWRYASEGVEAQDAPEEPAPELERAPEPVMQVARPSSIGVRGHGKGGGGLGSLGTLGGSSGRGYGAEKPTAPPPAPAPTATVPPVATPGPLVDDRPSVVVQAVSVAVSVPAVGQAVRYQRLLLPADAPLALPISAVQPRRTKDETP